MVVKEPNRRRTNAAYGKRTTAGSAGSSSDLTGSSSSRRVSSIRRATAGDAGSEVSSPSTRPGRASYIRPTAMAAAGETGSGSTPPNRSRPQHRTLDNSDTSGPGVGPRDNPLRSRPTPTNPGSTSGAVGATPVNTHRSRSTNANTSTSAPPAGNASRSGVNRLAVKEFCNCLLVDPRLTNCQNLKTLLESAVERIGEDRDFHDYILSLEKEFKIFAGPGGFNGIKAGSPIGDRMLKSLYVAEKRAANCLLESGETIWDEVKLKALHRVVRSIDGYNSSAVRDICSLFSYFHPEVTTNDMKKKMKALRTKAVNGNFCYEALIDLYGPDDVWTNSMNGKLITSIGEVTLAKVNLELVDDSWVTVEDEPGRTDFGLAFTVDDVKCRIKLWQNHVQHYEQAKAKVAKRAAVQDTIDLD